MRTIVKRDGRVVPYDSGKIAMAIKKAFMASGEVGLPEKEIYQMCLGYAEAIGETLDAKYDEPIDIEDIQNEVEVMLMQVHPITAKAYIVYRENRTVTRQRNDRLMQTYHNLVCVDSKTSNLLRENANINGDTAMGTMLKFGSEGAKEYYKGFILSDESKNAHIVGDIHIHDMDFLTLTTTCTQIDIAKLFEGGFSTGHGYLREPSNIISYAALAAIAIQANQNDQHGGQSIPNFDRGMALGVVKTFKKEFSKQLTVCYEDFLDVDGEEDFIKQCIEDVQQGYGEAPALENTEKYDRMLADTILTYTSGGGLSHKVLASLIKRARKRAVANTEKQTHQAMEAFVHNLNTMHSRAGAQVPFSSINYGTDTTPEGRMVIRNILLATEEGLGNGETPIFPIQIFRVQKGRNFEKSDPNYDLFKLACRVSAKRLFPNFAFQDAPFNKEFYDPARPETEIAYMGCRTRVVSNVHDPDNAITHGRGNLSFTSINLPRLAIEAVQKVQKECPKGNAAQTHSDRVNAFCKALDEKMELVVRQILDRFKIQCSKKVRNFPFLMGQGVWLGSDSLDMDDSVAEILKHGSLSIGFIGLAETLTMLMGEHHGESEDAQKLGLELVGRMRNFCDLKAKELKLNFTLLATPAEGLSGRFVEIDKKKYGIIPGVTDKEYYTNSFHVPVLYGITAFDKIRIEAPYHALTNAGHISYVEMDGDPTQNLEAFEIIVRHMAESGVGYGAINHPVDHDTVCGYNGIINDVCPKCGRREDDGPAFERIRRITGYLVGTTDRFNDAKRAEERDRVKHQ